MAGLQALQRMLRARSVTGFEKSLAKVVAVSASDGKCTCQFVVDETHVNPRQILHGGFVATLVDVITTNALELTSQVRGVTVNLNISCMKSAKLGDEITIDARCLKVGRTMAFLEAELRDQKGNLVATGKHTKFVGSVQNK